MKQPKPPFLHLNNKLSNFSHEEVVYSAVGRIAGFL